MDLSWVEDCAPSRPQDFCNQRLGVHRPLRERSFFRLRSEVFAGSAARTSSRASFIFYDVKQSRMWSACEYFSRTTRR
jgi:hypothetical protein